MYLLEKGEVVELLFVCLQLIGGVSTVLSYISVVYQKDNVRKIFNELQGIFDECKF